MIALSRICCMIAPLEATNLNPNCRPVSCQSRSTIAAMADDSTRKAKCSCADSGAISFCWPLMHHLT
jgi:hypothetical protein